MAQAPMQQPMQAQPAAAPAPAATPMASAKPGMPGQAAPSSKKTIWIITIVLAVLVIGGLVWWIFAP